MKHKNDKKDDNGLPGDGNDDKRAGMWERGFEEHKILGKFFLSFYFFYFTNWIELQTTKRKDGKWRQNNGNMPVWISRINELGVLVCVVHVSTLNHGEDTHLRSSRLLPVCMVVYLSCKRKSRRHVDHLNREGY